MTQKEKIKSYSINYQYVIAFLSRRNFLINPNLEPELFFDRNELKKWVEKIINYSIPTGGRICTLIYGEKNSGKTHFLKYIQLKIISLNTPLVEYINLTKVIDEFDLYLSIVQSLSRVSFIEDFIELICTKRNRTHINKITSGNVISLVSEKLNYKSEDIYNWLYGASAGPGYLTNVKKDPYVSRAVLSELLRAFYIMNSNKYPLLLFDHIEDIFNEYVSNYMNNNSKMESVKLLRVVMEYANYIFALNTDFYLDFKTHYPKFNSAANDEINITHLTETDVDMIINDINSNMVDVVKLESQISKIHFEESFSILKYPLSDNCLELLKQLNKLQPGMILKLLDSAIKNAESKNIVTKCTLKNAIKKIDPKLLMVCDGCHLTLTQLNLLLVDKKRGSELVDVKCPLCGKSLKRFFLPLVFRRVVLDTSALVDGSVSAILNSFNNIGNTSKLQIIIPQAVRGEIAGWEKRHEMFRPSRMALDELRNIRKFERRNSITINYNAGRAPTRLEIIQAKYSNSIDKIISEIALHLQATLVTSDKLLTENASSLGIFSILNIKEKNNKYSPQDSKWRNRRVRR